MSSDEVLALVMHEARRKDFSINRINRQRSPNACDRTLLIGGKRCAIFHTTRIFQSPRTRSLYSRLEIRKRRIEKAEMAIVVQEIGDRYRTLIIPADVLGREIVRKRKTFYLPIEQASPGNTWWPYNDAWHLLIS